MSVVVLLEGRGIQNTFDAFSPKGSVEVPPRQPRFIDGWSEIQVASSPPSAAAGQTDTPGRPSVAQLV